MKTGRFLRVWNTSSPAHLANVVDIILPKKKEQEYTAVSYRAQWEEKKRKKHCLFQILGLLH